MRYMAPTSLDFGVRRACAPGNMNKPTDHDLVFSKNTVFEALQTNYSN